MAREKRPARRSLSISEWANRDLPQILARNANNPERIAQLARSVAPHEVGLPTDWLGQIKRERKEKKAAEYKADLEKLRWITAARLHGGRVTEEELAWATKMGDKIFEEERRRKEEELAAAERKEVEERKRVLEGDDDDDSEAELTSVSNISQYDPSPRKKARTVKAAPSSKTPTAPTRRSARVSGPLHAHSTAQAGEEQEEWKDIGSVDGDDEDVEMDGWESVEEE